jgi:hypothetical protein
VRVTSRPPAAAVRGGRARRFGRPCPGRRSR